MSIKAKIKSRIREGARQLDKAIDLGIAAAYPLVFNMPLPDPPPDWKYIIRLGWRMVKVTTRETTRVLMLQRKEKR
jgi:hypothetical protein